MNDGRALSPDEHRVWTAYKERAISELSKLLDRLTGKTPYLRRRALKRAANAFHEGRAWRGQVPKLAAIFADGFLTLAAEQVSGKAGSPKRASEASQIPERRYVNRAVDELTRLALSQQRPDWAFELLKPGYKNKASQGRRLLFNYAMKLAKADSVPLDPQKLRVQIRERAKAAPTHINFLARGRKRRKSRPLIKARYT